MRLKKTTRLVIATTVLGFSSVYGAGVGFYGGLQIGVGKNNQQSLPSSDVPSDVRKVANRSTSTKLFLKNPANILMPTFNVVAQPIFLTPPTLTSFTNKSHNQLFLGRLFLGYQFKTWLGFEMGLSALSNTNLRYDATNVPAAGFANETSINNVKTSGTLSFDYGSVYRQDVTSAKTLDLFLKLSLPFYDTFDLYVKFGGAFVHSNTNTEIQVGNLTQIQDLSGHFSGLYNSSSSFATSTSNSLNTFSPAIGFGADYYFSPTMSAGISWTSIFVKQNTNNNGQQNNIKNNTNFIAVDITIHNVDRYCGQFLCDE